MRKIVLIIAIACCFHDDVLAAGGAAGSDKQVQFNNVGHLDASPDFTFDRDTRKLQVGDLLDLNNRVKFIVDDKANQIKIDAPKGEVVIGASSGGGSPATMIFSSVDSSIRMLAEGHMDFSADTINFGDFDWAAEGTAMMLNENDQSLKLRTLGRVGLGDVDRNGDGIMAALDNNEKSFVVMGPGAAPSEYNLFSGNTDILLSGDGGATHENVFSLAHNGTDNHARIGPVDGASVIANTTDKVAALRYGDDNKLELNAANKTITGKIDTNEVMYLSIPEQNIGEGLNLSDDTAQYRLGLSSADKPSVYAHDDTVEANGFQVKLGDINDQWNKFRVVVDGDEKSLRTERDDGAGFGVFGTGMNFTAHNTTPNESNMLLDISDNGTDRKARLGWTYGGYFEATPTTTTMWSGTDSFEMNVHHQLYATLDGVSVMSMDKYNQLIGPGYGYNGASKISRLGLTDTGKANLQVDSYGHQVVLYNTNKLVSNEGNFEIDAGSEDAGSRTTLLSAVVSTSTNTMQVGFPNAAHQTNIEVDDPNQSITLHGATFYNYVNVADNYTLQDNDTMIGVDTSGGSVTISLPQGTPGTGVPGQLGRKFTVTDETCHAAAHPIVMRAVFGEVVGQFPGAAQNYAMNVDCASVSFYWNGSKWIVVK